MATSTLVLTITRADTGYTATLVAALPNGDAQLAAGVALTLSYVGLRALELLPDAYGAALTAMVFPAPLREAWARGRGAGEGAAQPIRLCLALDAGDDALHALLWETLRDPLTNLPLARGEAVRLARYLPSASMADLTPPPRPSLRAVVAVAAATPVGAAPVDVPGLTGAAGTGLSDIPKNVLDGRDGRPAATLANLTSALRDGAPILFLACHGALVEGEPYLWLEQAEPGPYRPVSGAAFVEALAQLQHKPLLVVLASCQGAGTSYAVLRAVGPQLARIGIGAVLAMREQISVETLDALLLPFFRELQRDGQIDRAIAAARAALGEAHPWWLPVLWLRARDGHLWREDVPPSTPPSGTTGTANVSGGTVTGTVIGVNQGTIQNFFGGQPGEDGEKLLVAYLDSLTEDCQRLRLHRLTGKRQDGKQRAGSADQLRLQDVYTSLTTDGPRYPRYHIRQPISRVNRFLERLAQVGRGGEHVVPERVLEPQIDMPTDLGPPVDGARRELRNRLMHVSGSESTDDTVQVLLTLARPELALEAIRAERRLVLLGEPGAGKSTALRYLALLLALRLRGTVTRIPGWPADDTPVPVVVPLGQVAAALRAGAADAYAALLQVLGDVLEAGVRVGLRRFLTPALREGGVLLLCDGLDELAASAADGGTPPRVAVAAALRRLARETKARIVVTSRVLPYQAPGDWKLLPEDGWMLRTVQPLAFGQTRAFVKSWYHALATTDPDLAGGKAGAHAKALITELEQTARLHPLVRSPLLLTMLAILHYNTGDVPRDRARLYEECVELLLDRWEPERQPGMPRASLIQRLGLPSLDPLRQVLHELAYQAQLQPPGDDGRGMIGVEPLTLRMFTFFKRLGSLAEAETKVQLFLTMLDDEDSGLLQRRGDEGYAFPHLTFQEYLVACHLADHPKMVEPAYGQWCGADRERWREVLLLLMGRLHQQGKAEEKGLPWLKVLAGVRLGKVSKANSQRRQDAVLAALSYAELRERGAFAGSMLDIEAELESPLGGAIRPLLETADAAIPLADRIAAAQVLGDLGDSRYPVMLDDWRCALAQRDETFSVTGDHYWRYVRPGTHEISVWNMEEQPVGLQIPAFWLARFPLTVAQYAPFVAEGYGKKAKRWWTPQGWKWKTKQQRTAPWGWDNPTYHGANQPVIGLTWYEATAFCAWLSEQLTTALPEGYVVRLPTEAEWEVAAAYDAQMQRQPYPWGDEEPTPERAIYNTSKLDRPAPVGCCPAGTAACGALDMAGNVWEWTTSHSERYPAQSAEIVTDFKQSKDFTMEEMIVPLRGGSWYNDSTNVRCGARLRLLPVNVNGLLLNGVRVCLAPRSR